MSNGTAALQLVDLPSASTPAVANPQLEGIEKKIGAAVASGVMAIALAASEYAPDRPMSITTKTWCGAMLGQVAQLRLNTLGELPNFAEIALVEGRRALRERVDGVLLTRLGRPGQVDVVITELINDVLAISGKVAADELVYRKQHSH